MMIRLCSIPCSISDFLTPFPSERKSGKTFSHLPPMWIKKSPQQQRRLTILEWSHQTIHTTSNRSKNTKTQHDVAKNSEVQKGIRCPADSAWWTSGLSNAHAPGAERLTAIRVCMGQVTPLPKPSDMERKFWKHPRVMCKPAVALVKHWRTPCRM